MIWGIFIPPLLWLQETLILETLLRPSGSKTFTNENQIMFTVGGFQNQMQ
jgi:hypothetical protein